MVPWLAQIRKNGWTRHLAEPRYKLVVLRRLAALNYAQRAMAPHHGKERVLDLLFPGGDFSGTPNRQRVKNRTRLPDELFAHVVGYYWGGALS